MSLIHTTALTESQKRAILALADACRSAEPITLSAPSEDGLDYYLVYEKEAETSELTAWGFLFFAPWEDAESVYTCEFTAFVHPAHRRRGHFTEMLNAALTTADRFEQEHVCQVDFCFLTDGKSPAASAVLETIGAEYWYSEYKMVRTLRESDKDYRSDVRIEQYVPGATGALPASNSDATGGLYTASLHGEIIGTCALLPSEDDIYLYAFQIKEAWQGQGHGKDFLKGMLAMIATAAEAKSKPVSVSVQVSGLNYIARRLYQGVGFRDSEHLDYYIY